MRIITDRPIYSNVQGETVTTKELQEVTVSATKKSPNTKIREITQLSTPSLPTTLESLAPLPKEKQKAIDKLKRKQERQSARATRQEERKEKRATRKAKRLAKRLTRAKDKTGRKKWFYPISRVFKGKKKEKDGSIVDVPQSNVVTASNGAQFDKKDISMATGTPIEQVTTQVVDAVVVTKPTANTIVTENTQLSPFISKPAEPIIDENKAAQEVLNSFTETQWASVADNKEIVQAEDGAMYISDETMSQEEEPEPDEKKLGEEKKGLGVWGWVGISAIVVGLVLGGVLIYKMSKSEK